MDRTNTQLPEVKLPSNQPNWFASHYLWGYAFLLLAFFMAVAFIYQMQYNQKPNEAQFCVQVISPARNPQTGETKEFPTPCDVPQGWEKLEYQPGPSTLQIE